MKTLLKIIVCLSFFLTLLSNASSDQKQQIKILTDFYKQYFNHEINLGYGEWPEMFSTELKNALNQNIRDCEKFVREYAVCGYSADFDPYTFSQESSGHLTFDNSLFRAVTESLNSVQVSFSLFPEMDKAPTNTIEYQFTKENGQWKVHDMEGSIYKKIEAERIGLIEENQKLRVVLMLFENAVREQQVNFFKMFVNTKTQICQKAKCRSIQSDEIDQLVLTLNKHYFSSNDKSFGVIYSSAPEITKANEGDKAEVGIFSFIFIDQLWMIERIDIDSL